MKFFWKDNILKFFGYSLLFFGIFILIVGIGMTFDSNPQDSSQGPSIAIVNFAFTIPGIIMIILGKKAQLKEERVKAVANLIKSYQRVKLDTIAQKLAIPVLEVEKHLSTALSKNLTSGFIDRTTEEFVVEGAKDMGIRFCTNCGSPIEKTYFKGETVKCKSCGSVLS